jgi:alpha-tubulin suppressor-like RCC1 family protein
VLAFVGCYQPVTYNPRDGGVDAGPSHDPVQSFALGDSFGCLVSTSGQLACWGRNIEHEVDVGSASIVPIPELRDGTWQRVAAGFQHACAIDSTNALTCWGLNTNGQLDGTVSQDSAPRVVTIDGETSWAAVSGGARHTCGIGTDGRLFCWGDNSSFALGSSDTKTTENEIAISGATGLLTDWTTIKAGQGNTCASSASTGLWCWGLNDDGQLGNGSVGSAGALASLPQPTGVLDVTSVGMTRTSTCAVTGSNALYCWGFAGNGDLGDAAAMNVATPAQSATPDWTSVDSSADQYLCGLRDNGSDGSGSGSGMYCWGFGFSGGFGDGNTYNATNMFQRVDGSGITAFAVGFNNDVTYAFAPNDQTDLIDADVTCALIGSALSCWGDNTFGELGDGTPTSASTPTPVIGLPPPSSNTLLAVAGISACAAVDGSVYCWGDNESGELVADSSVHLAGGLFGSAQRSGLDNVTAISAGLGHTCAAHDGGGLRCWGGNAALQLGGASSPTEVSNTAGPFVSVIASYDTTCATESSVGTVCFGLLSPLGGSAASPPTHSAALDSITALAFADAFSCMESSGSQVSCTGGNSLGQFGNGTTTSLGSGAFSTGGPIVSPVVAARTNSGLNFGEYMCGVTNGGVACWGANHQGELGEVPGDSNTGGPDESDKPVSIGSAGGNLTGCTAVSASNVVACAICDGGSNIYCWGGDQYGGVGDGNAQTTSPVAPTALPSGGDAWVQIGAGLSFTCATHHSGKVECWGRGFYGELGNGTATRLRPGQSFVDW